MLMTFVRFTLMLVPTFLVLAAAVVSVAALPSERKNRQLVAVMEATLAWPPADAERTGEPR